jgi:hypothetical protein
MAGGMGFALGGAFGLFMSSVRLRVSFPTAQPVFGAMNRPSKDRLSNSSISTILIIEAYPDVLRYASHSTRTSTVQSPC